jgi:hypothetical protein
MLFEIQFVWDDTSCQLVNHHRRFEGTAILRKSVGIYQPTWRNVPET